MSCIMYELFYTASIMCTGPTVFFSKAFCMTMGSYYITYVYTMQEHRIFTISLNEIQDYQNYSDPSVVTFVAIQYSLPHALLPIP